MTWFRADAKASVIDFPLRLTRGAETWVATIWPDPRAGTGWAGLRWRTVEAERGFVPMTLELGDVIEFGVRHHHPGGSATPSATAVNRLWHGYLHSIRADGIVLHGPYPGPQEAYAAAQHALLAQIRENGEPGGADHPLLSARSRTSSGAGYHGNDPVPAQPPAGVSLAFHGQSATVGDPVHGWLIVDAERLVAAMTRPADTLRADLDRHLSLHGDEPLLTLAALTAHHLPDPLTLPPTLTQPIPDGAPTPTVDTPAAETSAPEVSL